MKWLLSLTAVMSGPTMAQTTPLFASEDPIRITIKGPVAAIARSAQKSTEPSDAALSLDGTAEMLPIKLSARGITRRNKDVCDFPPLRVQFTNPPPDSSLFAHQRKLKLVTHCRSSEAFQQHLLLEYSAYKIFNLISPASFRVRLATVNYAESSGKVTATRWGFFIEDVSNAAHRIGMKQAKTGDRILPNQLDPQQAARVALFEYMIGNLDWSMRAGPKGEGCCHNGRLIGGSGPKYTPLPYDFDYSGLVDAPYAVPPEGFKINSVKDRVFRGYCQFNPQAGAAAAEFRAQRPAIEGIFGRLPLTDRTRGKALGYLADFYSEIADDNTLSAKVLKNCI